MPKGSFFSAEVRGLIQGEGAFTVAWTLLEDLWSFDQQIGRISGIGVCGSLDFVPVGK